MQNLNFFSAIFCFLILSCSEKVNNYYAGIVVDEAGKPIANAVIQENNPVNTKKAQSDKNGFFKLNREEGVFSNLKVQKEGYKTGIAITFETSVDPKNWEDGETTYTSFVTSDTTKIVLQKEEIQKNFP